MAEHSSISWTDATWPIVAGCSYESPGCSNCWAVRDSWRLAHNPNPKVHGAYFGTVDKRADGKLVWSGVVRVLYARLDWPFKWRNARRIFVCSQSDLFHEQVPFEFIAASFGVMAAASWHTFQVLTKHPRRALEFFQWLDKQGHPPLETCLWHAHMMVGQAFDQHAPFQGDPPDWPLPNVWFGVTIEDQKRAEERLPLLLRMPSAVRWISAEPMLEVLDLVGIPEAPSYFGDVDLVVCGGESAQTREHTRPFAIEWARDLLDQCRASKVAFHMKQLGTCPTWLGFTQPGQHWPASMLKEDRGDGFFRILPPAGKSSRYKFHEPEHWPEDLRVQEMPA